MLGNIRNFAEMSLICFSLNDTLELKKILQN